MLPEAVVAMVLGVYSNWVFLQVAFNNEVSNPVDVTNKPNLAVNLERCVGVLDEASVAATHVSMLARHASVLRVF
jgi:hypothetical protein